MPRSDGSRRNIRTIERIVQILEDCDDYGLSTREIHARFFDKWPKCAPTMPRLGNMLAKCKEFEEVGETDMQSLHAGYSYPIKVWGLRIEAATHN